MEKKKTIFKSEQRTLEQARSVLKDEQYQQNPLLSEFSVLMESYEKMYNQFCRLIKLSDNQQLRLNELNLKLAKSNASKDKFFSIISHDLRSPFTAIIGFSEILKEQIQGNASKEELLDSAKIVHTVANNLYALLENLLTWSRIQRGAIEWQPEEVELAELIGNNIAYFTSQSRNKKINLKNLAMPGMRVHADLNMASAVMRNLISNAIKFTPCGGTIEISTRPNNADLFEVSVSDTGIGISPGDISKLFRIDIKYYTVGTAGEKGTGLGLNLCKEFIEKNGGTIWVESKVGVGTTFTFTLPRSPQLEPEASEKGQITEHKDQERRCFLTTEGVAALPEELRFKLQKAANKLDSDLWISLIEEIRQYNPTMADSLADLVKTYRFDILQKLLKKVDQ